MTYQEALTSLTRLITSYPEIRRVGSLEELQELRDQISESLFHFGDTYAFIRANSERAESNYKMCIEENKVFRRKQLEGKKGSVTVADSEAILDCREKLEEMHTKNEQYYLAQNLILRVDQVLNSLSSRLKLNSRHE